MTQPKLDATENVKPNATALVDVMLPCVLTSPSDAFSHICSGTSSSETTGGRSVCPHRGERCFAGPRKNPRDSCLKCLYWLMIV